MSNRWTHLVCTMCWNARQIVEIAKITPASPEDFDDDAEPCCACGTMTSSGIYVRDYPEKMKCRAGGPAHA